MKNKIYIVGTMHKQRTSLISEGLYQLLGEIRPEIVLFECPFEVQDEMMQWLDGCIEAGCGLEASVVKRYMKHHQIILKPYDIKGRNDYYAKHRFQFIDQDRESILADLLQRPDLAPLTKSLNEMNESLDKMFWGDWDALSLRELNNSESDRRVKHQMALKLAIDRALMGLSPELQPYVKAYERWENYEHLRDKAMARNILAYNQQYSDSTIVVICGFFHRFAIIELLRKADNQDFSLITDIYGVEESSRFSQ
ncbi:MAG: hypothetical protein LHW64_10950 [Candidatus Cloacimonetes bacterium]|jgi:hypothetical protein|nr:hypothetical protein [Candidatus Cloacimonadota bacterium]MCB5288300.1 hypothetical protein [Candidatus Cloacimonadota bacterium]MCK9185468.1 hypothetical protein [Candidatus Cloacimonadota bacterium]MCK9584740.1 hypothetical protein [Candidatus Cloacimonadota bacterium]MDY0230614.1 hypothetical protein [Candidatus Cloacimonadaceae bacterium]